MNYQSTFKRYEIKYMLNRGQRQAILQAMLPYMKLDSYGHTTIRNIYFDTENYRLIRRSLEKPIYKEKLRIRSYKQAKPSDTVFVELKKKYDGIVYKRRLILLEEQAMESFYHDLSLPVDSQIADEIEYFRSYYVSLRPVVFLSYEREAFYALDGGDFRITFDENILYRDCDFSLGGSIYGIPLTTADETLMEVKTSGGLPLWLTYELNCLGVYCTSFSKYGAAYMDMTARSKTEGQGRVLYAC